MPHAKTNPKRSKGLSVPLLKEWGRVVGGVAIGISARGRAALALGLVSAGLAACTAAEPQWVVPREGTLHWSNPGRYELILERVAGAKRVLGNARTGELCLPEGRYVLHAGPHTLPVPLLADALEGTGALRVALPGPIEAPEGFLFVPGGPTLVGDVLGVGAVDERPARIVELPAFFLGKTEVTNAQYRDFLNAIGRCEEAWLDLGGPRCGIARHPKGGFLTASPQLPVVTVSHSGAQAYCEWKTLSEDSPHRLPTEQEWERAARGPRSSTYAYGDVYQPEAANQESGELRKVGGFLATGWGGFDLTGNAFEWTASRYDDELMVLRGGSYVLDGPYLRNAFRMRYRPQVRADDIGFRVLREIP